MVSVDVKRHVYFDKEYHTHNTVYFPAGTVRVQEDRQHYSHTAVCLTCYHLGWMKAWTNTVTPHLCHSLLATFAVQVDNST